MSGKVEDNRQAQSAAYGEPLSDTFDRIKDAFALNQSSLASVLGLSAPMLSQLNSAQRVKIGNPAVLNRMYQLNELVEHHAAGRVAADELATRLEEIKTSQATLGRTTQMMASQAPDTAVVAGIRNLLRAVASGTELRDAAERLAATHPDLAEVLRIYGTGPAHPAVEHYARHKDLF